MTNAVQNTPSAVQVGIASYDGVQLSAVFGLGEMFELANRVVGDSKVPTIRWNVLTEGQDHWPSDFDAVVVPPNLTSKRGAGAQGMHRWLRDRHTDGALVASACAGAFWLGHAGLLDGRCVTTHWALEAEFREAFPKAQLQPEHLLIDDNDIVTAGGLMAWIDLGLHLIGKWQGPTVVTRVSRHMLIDPNGREQRNYRSFKPNLAHGDDSIRQTQLWMEQNVGSELSVSVLAQVAGLPDRTFQRRFQKATGLAMGKYIQELRVEKARALLERTNDPVSHICWAVGYEDPSAFSRLFKTIAGVSAKDYRHRFRVT